MRGHDRAAEEVRGDAGEVVAQRVGDGLVRRVAAERVLRDQRVEDDDRGEGERERVGELRAERQPPRARGVERDACERDEQQDVLPRLDRGERVAADAGRVERVHRRVVERERRR